MSETLNQRKKKVHGLLKRSEIGCVGLTLNYKLLTINNAEFFEALNIEHTKQTIDYV